MTMLSLVPYATAMEDWKWELAKSVLHEKPLDGDKNSCWMKKSDVTQCSVSDCTTTFSSYSQWISFWSAKKHHCYVCGKVVCGYCTSNSWWYNWNSSRKCQNLGAHQNREIECLQRRIKLGSDKNSRLLREMMIEVRELVINPNVTGDYYWTKNYLATGGRTAVQIPHSANRVQNEPLFQCTICNEKTWVCTKPANKGTGKCKPDQSHRENWHRPCPNGCKRYRTVGTNVQPRTTRVSQYPAAPRQEALQMTPEERERLLQRRRDEAELRELEELEESRQSEVGSPRRAGSASPRLFT